MMFFLPGSPHLGEGQTDYGFDQWDYPAVAEWAERHSRGSVVLVQ